MTYCICRNEENANLPSQPQPCSFVLTQFVPIGEATPGLHVGQIETVIVIHVKTYNEKEKFRKLFKSPFGQILKSAGTLHYPSSLLTYLSPAVLSLAQVTSLFSIRLPWKYHVDVLPFIILVMSHSGHFQVSFPRQQFWAEQGTMPTHSLSFYTARCFFP